MSLVADNLLDSLFPFLLFGYFSISNAITLTMILRNSLSNHSCVCIIAINVLSFSIRPTGTSCINYDEKPFQKNSNRKSIDLKMLVYIL